LLEVALGDGADWLVSDPDCDDGGGMFGAVGVEGAAGEGAMLVAGGDGAADVFERSVLERSPHATSIAAAASETAMVEGFIAESFQRRSRQRTTVPRRATAMRHRKPYALRNSADIGASPNTL
jgi:hypothetical protein